MNSKQRRKAKRKANPALKEKRLALKIQRTEENKLHKILSASGKGLRFNGTQWFLSEEKNPMLIVLKAETYLGALREAVGKTQI